MKRLAVLAAILFPMMASAQTSDALKVKSFTLDNGLTVWINEDPNQTAVYGAVVVKAGAVDCPGTGIAHYFEHMMFKGTDKIGTVDYAAEKPYLDSIAQMYDSLSRVSSDSLRSEIQMEINRLSIKAADYAIPNEFDNLVSEMGGSSLNAFTSYDETVYHNKFLPEYFEQWAELNSERIMNPVFRLFQSELETVYEEKNRSEDNLVSDFQKSMLRSVYEGSGYSEDVLGTTENLKNPRLSQMAEFFDKYYVAGNMGLVLTGNINADKALPVIKKTFGRIRKGGEIERQPVNLAPIVGHKDVYAMINMPIVRIGAICFRGPSKKDEDFLGVSFLTSLLNNEAGTGLLDKLTVDHKLMVAMAMPDLSFNNAGSIMVLYMPKLLFQREKKATELIFKTFETLKSGDFSDEFFEGCKLSFKKQILSETENLSERMVGMAFTFSEGADWNEYISRADRIDAMTREDVIALANKYLGNDFIQIHKKKGIAVKDNLKKPDYEKVVPKNKEAASQYAVALRKSAEKISVIPRAVDFEKDADIVEINPLVKVYAAGNPYNNVFDLDLRYAVGTNEIPALSRLAGYVGLLGTADKSFDEIHAELQKLGGSVGFSVSGNSFTVSVSGYDSNFKETLSIVSDLVSNIKGDKKKLARCKVDEKSSVLMNRSSIDALDDALFQKVVSGDKSEYLVDKGKFSDEVLLGLFADVQKVECDVLYSGTIPVSEVAAAVSDAFDLKSVSKKSNGPVDIAPLAYDTPEVFFVDKKDASQSLIRCFLLPAPMETQKDRYFANMFISYLGGGMSSLLFQEIREFRSMAYSTYAYMDKPSFRNAGEIAPVLVATVGTQSDKTIDAMTIVDSLLTKTPFLENKIATICKEALNERCNQYPDFRGIPSTIAYDLRNGYEKDPVEDFIYVVKNTNPGTMEDFWKENVSGRNIVWCIVGSARKVDMAGLEKFGPVTTVKSTEIIR